MSLHKNKKNQTAYKPGSVPMHPKKDAQRLPFIRALCCQSALSFYPPTRLNMKYIKNSNEQLSNVGIHELSTSDVYSLRVATQLVGSYSTFSPLPLKNKWRLFSSTLIHPCERLPVKKQNALCCPDFPPAPQW